MATTPTSPDLSNINYLPYWHNIGQVWPLILSQMQPNAPPMPGTFQNPYGGYLSKSFWASQQSAATFSSYQYAQGLDSENTRVNTTMILGRFIASSGIKPSKEQMNVLQKIVGYVADYAPMGLQIAENILATESPDGISGQTATQVIAGIRNTIDALNGPQGSQMPLYQQMRSALSPMPLGDQGAFLQSYLQYTGGIGNNNIGGYMFRDLAQIQNFALHQGYNPAMAVNRTIISEQAKTSILDPSVSVKQQSFMSNMITGYAEQQLGKETSSLAKVNTIDDAAWDYMQYWYSADAAGDSQLNPSIAEWDLAQQGIALTQQARKWVGVTAEEEIDKRVHDGPEAPFFYTQPAINSVIEALDNRLKTETNAANKQQIEALKEKIRAYGQQIGDEGYASVRTYEKIREHHRNAVRQAMIDDGIADSAYADVLADTHIKIQRLNEYGLSGADLKALNNKVKDENGDEIYAWQQFLQRTDVAQEAKDLVSDLFSTGMYDRYKQDMEDYAINRLGKTEEEVTAFIEKVRAERDPEKRAELMNSEMGRGLQNFISASIGGQMASQATSRLSKAVSHIHEALQTTGSQLQTPQQAEQFLDMISQGGLTWMPERLENFAGYVAAGMTRTGMTDNEVAQLSAWGHNAAQAVGGDTRQSGVVAVKAGIAAVAAAQKYGRRNTALIEATVGEAAGAASHSVLFKTIAAIGAKLYGMNDEDITGPNRELLLKIKHGQNLTEEERSIIENAATGTQLMLDAGYRQDQIVVAQNRTYTGDISEYAQLQATAQMSFSKVDQAQFKKGMNDELKSQGLTENFSGKEDTLYNYFKEVAAQEDQGLITDVSQAENLKTTLIAKAVAAKDWDLAKRLRNTDATALQAVLGRAVDETAATRHTDVTGIQTMLAAATGMQEEHENISNEAAYSALFPSLPKDKMGTIVSVLANKDSNLGDVLRVLNTAVTEKVLGEENLDTVFNGLAMQAVTDPRFIKDNGLDPDKQALVSNVTKIFYAAGGNTQDWKTIVNKVLTGGVDSLSDDELKIWESNKGNINSAMNMAGISTEQAQTAISYIGEVKSNIDKKFHGAEPSPLTSSTPPELNNPQQNVEGATTPGAPADTPADVPSADTTPDTVPDAGRAGNKGKTAGPSDSGDSSTTPTVGGAAGAPGSSNSLGSSQANPLYVTLVQNRQELVFNKTIATPAATSTPPAAST